MKKLIIVLVTLSILLFSPVVGCGNKAEAAGVSSSSGETVINATVTGNELPPQKLVKSDIPLKIVSMTNPVWPGDEDKITIQTEPNKYCLTNFTATNAGIMSDEKGIASFIIKIDEKQQPGYLRLDIQVGTKMVGIPPNTAIIGTVSPNYPKSTWLADAKAEMITSIFVN